MAKLHELLAVESNLTNQANKVRGELTQTFEKKVHHFGEALVTFVPNSEGAAPVTEAQRDIQTTVVKEVEWISKILAKAYDVSHAIDIANTFAQADVTPEDMTTPLLTGIPATSLLQLEKRIQEVHDLVVAIPTLDPAKGFVEDTAKGKGIYKAREVVKTRTKKSQKPLVLYEATKEHPAQTQMVTEDVPVGEIREQEWSSLITPALKADLLDRCDMLLRAVKKARSKANEQDVDVATTRIGKKLLDYIFQPLFA